MKLRQVLGIAMTAVARNKTRAALTALGIVIGIGAVIAMTEIGQGSASAIRRTIESMGANNLLVFPGTAASGGVSFGAGSALTLTPEDAEAIQRDCPAAGAAAPIVRARTQVVYGHENWVPQYIYGTTPEYVRVRDWLPLAAGEPFTDRDVRGATCVCLVGSTLVRELFQGETPVGREIRIKNTVCRVIGVLQQKGANMMGMDQDDIVLAPWTTIKYRVSNTSLGNTTQSTSAGTGGEPAAGELYPGGAPLYPAVSATQQADTPLPVRFANVDQIALAARDGAATELAQQQVTRLLRERHRLRGGEPDDFTVRDMTEITRNAQSTAAVMTNCCSSSR
jgi:ABC-type antimicrobial peptide transport system permease subunit